MNSQIIDFVRKTYGCAVAREYYDRIDLWLSWWSGYNPKFHRVKINNGIKVLERDFYTLKMGKKVCEDWASVLLNDKTHFKISDEKASEYVQGELENGGVLNSNSFRTEGNRLIEKAFATGTGAVTLRLENAHVKDGDLIGGSDTLIKLCYMSADCIIPVSYDNGRICEAAFCSEHIRKGKKYFLLEVHMLEDSGYVIHNHWFSADGDSLCETELPDGIVSDFSTGSKVPWFAVFSPNISNDIPGSGGMGVSILHGAIDILKGVDLAYNNFCRDFELGGKKVFMLKTLTEELEDGTPVAPDDVGQQLFVLVKPDSINPDNTNGGKFIQEFNPSLRVQENNDGIQSQLDKLSFRCGLGNKHYQFNNGSVVTATQYTGDKQDLLQNAHKHYITVDAFLRSLIKSIIHIGRRFCGWDVTEEAKITVVFDKSVVIDEASERERDRQDVKDGLMAQWEYRVKWFGETEDEAKKKIAEIKAESNGDDGDPYSTEDFE